MKFFSHKDDHLQELVFGLRVHESELVSGQFVQQLVDRAIEIFVESLEKDSRWEAIRVLVLHEVSKRIFSISERTVQVLEQQIVSFLSGGEVQHVDECEGECGIPFICKSCGKILGKCMDEGEGTCRECSLNND